MKKLTITLEQTKPGYAHSYVIRDEVGKELGQIWNSTDGTGALLAQISGSFALATAVREMFHDIQIFYTKHREPGNRYFAEIKRALNQSFKYTPGWEELK